ncbi:ribosome small subunit-dependent GTPase A [Sediminibacillus massiliensis]|uniref:ribosome small subunit-dependent GTPase A n=1 Tax=Sediminibacillus massiliensis TaxID=1926277 RepID=UPI0009888CD3|nr:ribosome small subunit-dependent GTPase A [Sediminibacillus massiliensis]
MDLKQIGLNDHFSSLASEYGSTEVEIGRVCTEYKGLYRIFTENGERFAEISGKMRYQSQERRDYPAVGDWVIFETGGEESNAIIQHILPRRSKFSRKTAGETTEEQIIATNIDTVFLVNALNLDFNLRRIERYLVLTWESGAKPVIVLTKKDLCEEVESRIKEVESVAMGVPVYAVSSITNEGFGDLTQHLTTGQTVALLGSSGAGKSTLANRLSGKQSLAVQEVRHGDDKGRHTTTHREMVLLPGGGILIDTPGMRELQLWDSNEGIVAGFDDIEAISEECRFRDCSHGSEPGCAVLAAIENGSLSPERLSNYKKLQKEQAYFERKADKRAQLQEKQKWKKIAGDRTRFHRPKH